MKSVDAVEAQARLDQILIEAQTEPIVIRCHGKDAAIVISIVEYEPLRAAADRAFLELRSAVALGLYGAPAHDVIERRLHPHQSRKIKELWDKGPSNAPSSGLNLTTRASRSSTTRRCSQIRVPRARASAR